MTKRINKDTQVCMSLAARPSNFGTRFHNYLYEALDLNYLYKAFSPTDLTQAISGVRGLGIRGCAISMPFKEACIPLVDELDASAKAYNTDYIAIARLLANYKVSPDQVFALRGSGGMAKAVACALKDAGFTRGYIVAIDEASGKQLAELYGYEWRPDTDGIEADLLINATPIGMAGGNDADKLSYSEQEVDKASVIFDVVALPPVTPLIRYARERGKTVIIGSEVFAIQAVEQFVLYTGIRPDDALFQKAAAWSRL
ncbi:MULTISPECIES: shikimate 5-dehydrogenase [Salmonella]|uniref:Shikimate 5-dehydrogenase n=8 Tax=Salmonella enterica TaxID=28901 RepID=A0A725VH74_SALEP|nr:MULTISPECIES: shikimate 5-dehydrogenase [Salmonella]pir/AH0955/ probable shikimate 5-dehydrogenase STY3924 [imported] - Salmonella enterica subsp. enterica serovar Typhi (strain CT18) [Salmonella enterica subsp. enterica serovar Typhi]EBH2515985.1 shikimate 5-dehydrogenase [Salmonella enterica subsp. enterica serovar Enteritidis]ECK9449387.1 shikimate 5-dehydrogenase [Salmonella enterica subsp. enterica serovar Typhi str. CFSAN000626]EDW0074644.1 shikimate 5-dehydrogenase [Salmonella enteric